MGVRAHLSIDAHITPSERSVRIQVYPVYHMTSKWLWPKTPHPGLPRAPATVATEGTDTSSTQDYAADTDTERKRLTRSLTGFLVMGRAGPEVFVKASIKSEATGVLGKLGIETIRAKTLNMPLRISQQTLQEQPGVPREDSCDAATSS